MLKLTSLRATVRNLKGCQKGCYDVSLLTLGLPSIGLPRR